MAEVPIAYDERVGRSKLSVVRDGSVFLQSMIWTVLGYNPVRILGLIGLAGLAFTTAVGIGLVVGRLSGITTLGPFGVAAVYAAMVSAVGGVSVFALGSTFSYLVSLISGRSIRQGLFGRPVFTPSLDHQFGWLGGLALVFGVILAAVSLGLSFNGWEIARLWLYLLGSAMLILLGAQLAIFWVLLRVLDELSRREILAAKDMGAA
jgi:hypothetical protein